MHPLVTALGWVGAVLCLAAYLLVSTGRWSAASGRYQLANVVSGLMLGTVAATAGVWPSAATNAVWAGVGLVTGLLLLRARRRTAASSATAVGTASAAGVGTASAHRGTHQPARAKGNDWVAPVADRRAHGVDA